MDPADLHQRDELRVGDLAGEMHPRQVQPARHLIQEGLLPAFVALGARAVALPVAADDHDMGLRAGAEDGGKRAHEDVEPAIGFKVAADIGQHLIAMGQPRSIGKLHLRAGVGDQP